MTLMEVVYTALATFLGGFVGKVIEKQKNKLELKSIEIDNATKNAQYYQGLLDDMARRYKEALDELEKATLTIKDKDKQIDELMDSIHLLTEELKKYKQLNGKS